MSMLTPQKPAHYGQVLKHHGPCVCLHTSLLFKSMTNNEEVSLSSFLYASTQDQILVLFLLNIKAESKSGKSDWLDS